MKTAHYIGTHRKDKLSVRIGWALTRLVQFGPFKKVTHSEAILLEYTDGKVLLGSSSARDGGVRQKIARLNPAHWLIIDVPQWDVAKAQAWFDLPANLDQPYSWGGAARAGLPFLPGGPGVFCNQAVGAAFLHDSSLFTPAEFAAICGDFGQEVTAEFFAQRAVAP